MGLRKMIAATVASLLLLAFGALAAHPTTQDPVPVRAGTPTTIRIEDCKTFWADERTISSKIPGKIDTRLVNDGQEVYEGDVLALLDSRDAEIELAIQEILGNSDLDEKTQREKLQEYITRLEIASKLIGHRVISEEEYRLAKVNVNVNEFMAMKEAEKRSVEQRKADRARVFLEDHVIKSPMHGVIKKCFKREKESVTTGELQLFKIVATDKVWVEGLVSVSELYRVRVGQEVEVRLAITKPERTTGRDLRLPNPAAQSIKNAPEGDRLPENRGEMPQEKVVFRGTIVFIDPDADFSARKFSVRAEVDNLPDTETGDPILRAGLSANMKIFLASPSQK